MKNITSVVNCRGGVNADIPTELGICDVYNVLKEMYELILGNDNIKNLTNIFCLVHPSVAAGLFDIKELVLVKDYPFPKMAVEREIGSINGIRFVLSKGMKTKDKSEQGATIYDLIVVCKEPYDFMFKDGFLIDMTVPEGTPIIVLKGTTYYD